ncbi:MAG TPA: UdgX family uracil-DNA binding protein [Acidimicrobiales bacterium]|nr:UdgX family uracil-DNA binding protein [Acidimicrobiales bacterium]
MTSSTAQELIPDHPTLDSLRAAAACCTACSLHKDATQTVFGSGSGDAPVMLVGEQPGDKEDLAGEPFVGPAGKLLGQALGEAGIDRRRVYLTNAVKHFKFTRRGKLRLHKKPSALEVAACRPWLEAELAVVRPQIVVLLGATAAQALLGSSFRVTKERGRFVDWPYEPKVTATVHPSSILRAPDEGSRQAELARFVQDLEMVAAALADRDGR